MRGEDRIAIIDVELARRASSGERVAALREYLPTINGPAQAWFSKDGALAFVASQKASQLDVFETSFDREGRSHPKRLKTVDIPAQDPRAFTPFLKTSPDGSEVWLSHKLADAVSAWSIGADPKPLDTVTLGEKRGPITSSSWRIPAARRSMSALREWTITVRATSPRVGIGIIDRSAGAGGRKVVGQFFSQGPGSTRALDESRRLYIAHEQDELPNTPNAGQTVCSVFDVSDPLQAAVRQADRARRSDLAVGQAAQQEEHQSRLRPPRHARAGRLMAWPQETSHS